MNDRIKVMLSTEGTYPYHHGGVSTWCDILVSNLKDIDYVLYSIVMNPFVTQKFTIPSNAELIKLPLWGTEEPSEHLSTPFSQIYIAKKRTVDKVINDQFMPLFNDLIDEIISDEKNPQKLGNTIVGLYKYFQEYEYKKSFKSELVWDSYKARVLNHSADPKNKASEPDIYSLVQSLGWLYRFLTILNTPLPKVNVTHSAAAAFCGIPCVLEKLIYGTPFLLTEHGVYLREQYLSLSQRKYPSFLSTFLMKLIHSVTSLNFNFADQISPVCQYNTRWEMKFGVKKENIKVIYNGVDKNVFLPDTGLEKNHVPTVVTVARIDPIKDIETLIRAAALVRDKISNVKFVVYGSITVPEYYDQCLELRKKLDLDNTFIFAGHTSDTPAAYRSGDIIALSSISEAFPYSVVEAMMTAKPIIATDVGGIKEALGDTGILVNPKHPEEFAQAIIKLIKEPEIRESLGEDARQRALNYFTLGRVLSLYMKSYINLSAGVGIADKEFTRALSGVLKKQRLYFEKGYTLQNLGYYEESIVQFRNALKELSDSTVAAVILTHIAQSYNYLGKYDMAFCELEKAEALSKLQKFIKPA